jgi:hypothetical protein
VFHLTLARRGDTRVSQSEESRDKVFEIAAPSLPLMIGAFGLEEDVLDMRLGERVMQTKQTGAHRLRLVGSHSQP